MMRALNNSDMNRNKHEISQHLKTFFQKDFELLVRKRARVLAVARLVEVARLSASF